MEQGNSFFLTYSIHFVLVISAFFLIIYRYPLQYKKRFYGGLVILSSWFLWEQIITISENETTLRIISHTKLCITYILFFFASVLLFIQNTSSRYRKTKCILWFLIALQSILYYLFFNLTGVGFNESIPFHLKSGIKGAGIGDFYRLIIDVSSAVFLLIGVGVFYRRFQAKENTTPVSTSPINKLSVLIFLFLLLVNPLNHDIYNTYKTVEEKPEFQFKDFYKKPHTEIIKPEKPYNLVWIYAEAFERIYLNDSIFPKLTPHLSQIEKKSLSFTNIHQVWGTGWTIAGIVASQCGIPLYAVGRQQNDLGKLPQFLPKVTGIGNILRQENYKCIFIQGSPRAFAGNDRYFASHGFDLFSFENIDARYKTRGNISRWGLNDDKTLDFAKQKYHELQKQGQPFALMLSTINTHSPHGFIPPSYKEMKYENGKNNTLNAFKVSDYLISKFIRDIKKTDTENNTMIVISSDHLTMKNLAYATLEKHGDKRKNLFMVYFPEKIRPYFNPKNGSTLDEGITVLELMGYKVQNLGFGVSLLGKEKSLSEKAGTHVDEVLKSWKKYYFQFWE